LKEIQDEMNAALLEAARPFFIPNLLLTFSQFALCILILAGIILALALNRKNPQDPTDLLSAPHGL